MSRSRADYHSVDADDSTPADCPALLRAVRWPREAGVFASMTDPWVRPRTAQEWWTFVTTTRGGPLSAHWLDNLKAGATVACVNLTLGVSLAIASGGTPTQGMVCSLWSAALTSTLGSSHFNVVGATSALSSMLEAVSLRYGPDAIGTVALYASFFLFAFALFRVDRAIRYVPTPVAHGFAIGVAIMLAAGQLATACGMRGLPRQNGFLPKMEQFVGNLDLIRPADATLFAAAAAALFACTSRWPRVPWVLVVATAAVALGYFALPHAGPAAAPKHQAPPLLFLLRERYPSIEPAVFIPGSVPSWIPVIGPLLSPQAPRHCASAHACSPTGPETWQFQPDVVFYSFGCAVVSLLETLISAQIANRMLRRTADDFDLLCRAFSTLRETLSLSLAAFASGICGAICPAAALARTSLNVKSGAFSRVAGVMHAVVFAVAAWVLMPLFEYMPFAVVGSILLLVSYRLIEFDELAALRKGDPAGMYLCLLTAIASLTVDSFAGLLVGGAIAFAMNARALAVPDAVRVCTDEHRYVPGGIHASVAVAESLTFANVQRAAGELEDVLVAVIDAGDRYFSVHVDLTRCEELDFDAAEALDDWARKVRLAGAKLTVDCGIHLVRILSITEHLNVPPETKAEPALGKSPQ